MNKSALKVWFSFILLMGAVISASVFISARFEVNKGASGQVVLKAADIKSDMSLNDFAVKTGLNKAQLNEVFGERTSSGNFLIGESGVTASEIEKRTARVIAIYAEAGSKNWMKILLKFFLWFVFIIISFRLISRGALNAPARIKLYAIAIAVFGVALGSDPGPMGTVKDAIVMYGADGAVFIPRMIAMIVFLSSIVIFNKSICAWGCQAGTLQDLVFRLNRNVKDTAGIMRQYKIPFYISNSIRIVFFISIIAAAFLYGADIVEPVDPFKIFKPSHIGSVGAIFMVFLFASSLFIYRPWCHLFCPFGLAGWALEKFSVYKVAVDREKCVSCGACVKACPSDAMAGILYEKRFKPDCFSCGVCIDICPEKAVSFKRGGDPGGKR